MMNDAGKNIDNICNTLSNEKFDDDVLSEAASLLCYSDDELNEYFTADDIAIMRATCNELPSKEYTIGDEQAVAYRMVAEDDASYGK